jgi:uncharacterized metal-binding protein YceD (DUF177 family)
LDDLTVPVEFYGTPVVKFAAANEREETPDDEDILWIPVGAKEVDLKQYFYDSIILSLPLQRVHPEGQCNKKMIEKLNKLRITHSNL